MMRIFIIGIVSSVLFACESSTELEFQPTQLNVTVLDDRRIPLEGAVVQFYNSKVAFERELEEGNTFGYIRSDFTDQNGEVLYSEDIDDTRDYYLLVSYRDRTRFTDLNNFNKYFFVSNEKIKRGSISNVEIELEPAKSALSFYSNSLEESDFPVTIVIDGQEIILNNNYGKDGEPSAPSVEDTTDNVYSVKLNQGVKSWYAVSSKGCYWSGELSIDGTESHEKELLNPCKVGNVTFWTPHLNSGLLPLEIVLNREDNLGFLNSTKSLLEDCFESDSVLRVARPSGEYSYYAISQTGECVWSGEFSLIEGACEIVELDNCQE